MVAFTAAVDVLFADPNLGRAATWEPADGDPFPVRIIARRGDAITGFGEARLWSETTRIDIRVAELAKPGLGPVHRGGKLVDAVHEFRDFKPVRQVAAFLAQVFGQTAAQAVGRVAGPGRRAATAQPALQRPDEKREREQEPEEPQVPSPVADHRRGEEERQVTGRQTDHGEIRQIGDP